VDVQDDRVAVLLEPDHALGQVVPGDRWTAVQTGGRHTPSYPRPIVAFMREGRAGRRQAATVRPSGLDGSDDSCALPGSNRAV
jgi:hypothetical protein